MNSDDIFPSKYIKASTLGGKPQIVTIDRVVIEELGQGNSKEKKPIVYFKGKEKGMVLNKTNWNAIAEIYGDESDDWRDGEIELFEAQIEFQGKVGPALRVRKVRKASKIETGVQKSVKEDMNDEVPF